MEIPEAMFPPSPPAENNNDDIDEIVDNSFIFLTAQAEAIQLLSMHFSPENREDGVAAHFRDSLKILKQAILSGGKVIFSGMGKSHKIGAKLSATLQSFGIVSCLLHASEALHGDVGCVRANDVVILISASGDSPELCEMMKHLPESTLTVCMTCNANSTLAKKTNSIILSPVETHHKEQYLYGLPAPTISSTLSLVLGDAMCLALFESLERDTKKRQLHFARHHPGGAIGLANFSSSNPPSTSQSTQGTPPNAALTNTSAPPNPVNSTEPESAPSPAPRTRPNHIEWSKIPVFSASALEQVPPLELWRSASNSPFLVVSELLFCSCDVWRAIETGADLSSVQGLHLEDTMSLASANVFICRNSTGQITGVISQ